MLTPERKEEFGLLMTLISECRNINSGSHTIERLQRIIELANKLDKRDLEKAKPSFMDYLIEELNKPSLQDIFNELGERCNVSEFHDASYSLMGLNMREILRREEGR